MDVKIVIHLLTDIKDSESLTTFHTQTESTVTQNVDGSTLIIFIISSSCSYQMVVKAQ